MNVLIVDDSRTNLVLLKGLVKHLPLCQVFAFNDPVGALTWCEQHTPDLVLVDYMMPVMDGLDFIRHFRAMPHKTEIPLIMISAVDEKEVVHKALALGAHDFIQKPIDQLEFLARTKNLLKLRQTQKQLEAYAHQLAKEVDVTTAKLNWTQERYELVARGTDGGLWDWDLTTNTIEYSPRWREMLGFPSAYQSQDPEFWFSRVHPDDIDHLQIAIKAHLANGTDHFEADYRVRHKSGRYMWVSARGLATRDKEDKPTRFAGSQIDISERKEAEEKLLYEAFHDGLTGLPNRALFMDRLTQSLVKKKSFSVLFIDVDRFKNINDSLGHEMGNELLVVLARRFERCCRAGDTVARFGGDEFAILAHNIATEEEAQLFAARLSREASGLVELEGREIFPTISIGIALSSTFYTRGEDLLRDADIAMYRAKINGKARFEIFQEDMRALTMTVFNIETKLRRALDQGEIILHYQPIIDLKRGSIAGFEALMRWDNPNDGMLSPDRFIPIAEETDLILMLGKLALEQSCKQLVEWHRLFPDRKKYFMCVNVSGKQLYSKNFFNDIEEVLTMTSVDPGSLKLEITETVLMKHPERIEGLMHRLKELGVQFSIDDFGTGYSSLSYLHRFPFDTLKIDKSFVEKIGKESKYTDSIKFITMLASSLGMTVVAEGVETKEELDQLDALQCDYGQGFYFSKPVAADEMRALLLEQGPIKAAS